MITLNLRDINLIDNFKAIQVLKQSGLFSEEKLQKLYDRQVKADDLRELQRDYGLKEGLK